MSKVILGDYVNIKTGKLDANASSEYGQFPFFTCSKEPLKIDTYSYDCECVLVAGNGDLNVKYYNGKFDAYQRTYIVESKNKQILYVPYLYNFLDSYLETLRTQSIGGVIKYIKLGNLTDAQLPLPPLETQQKIADELDKITALIQKRKSQIEKLDLLTKAKFVEMFGDPVTNEMGWEKGTIRDIAKEVKYGTSKPSVDGGKYPYLRMNNITYDGHLDLTNLKYIDIDDKEYEKCVVRNGDILFNRTNSKELVGKTCVYNLDTEMIIAGYIIRVRVNEKVIPLYLSAVLNSKYGKETLFDMCKAIVGQANINAQELQDIKILIPPLDLQNQFAQYVEKIEKIRYNMEKGLEQLEVLYKERMQEYFG